MQPAIDTTKGRQFHLPHADYRAFLIAAILGAGASIVGLAGCGGGGSGVDVSGSVPGSIVTHPQNFGSARFVADPNHGGRANSMKITGMFWGRLVNVRDSNGALQQTDMVVGEDIQTDIQDFLLDSNPITGETTVIIRHPYSDSNVVNGVETSPYQRAFRRLDQNLIPIKDKSLDPNELPPFSLVPRNAAIMIRFDDLLDESTITAETIKVLSGNPPTTPFTSSRIIPDINHGDLAGTDAGGQPVFHTTRVIIDTTVSQLEASTSNPPLPANALGLPPSSTNNQANIAVRIPTKRDLAAGQVNILRNLSAHPVSFTGNGSRDTASPTNDTVRAMRSGGSTDVTNDAHNGFLLDIIPPRVVGTQPVFINVTPVPEAGGFATTLTFNTLGCAAALKVGDIIQQMNTFAQVTQASAAPIAGTVEAHFRVVSPLGGTLTAGLAQVSTAFDPIANFGKQACFVRFLSQSTPPAAGVATDSAVTVRFSEPMDPGSVTPFDSFTLTRDQVLLTADAFVVGEVKPATPELREFRFESRLPLRHQNSPPTDEQYFVTLSSGTQGPTDLAGNPLAAALPRVAFRLDPNEPLERNAGFALRFGDTDELFDDDAPEVRGQYLNVPQRAILRPRAVTHFPAVADRTQPVPSLMPSFGTGVQTPLSGLGSKMHTIWRYCDVGFALEDETNTNVDVEGLNWSPVGGAAVADTFERFEISLCHAQKLPDETVDPMALLPSFKNSGLVRTFASNQLDSTNDPLRVVHPRGRGYNVNPADLFRTANGTGTAMMPFPLNRGIPKKDFKFYTWRDTALQALGAPVGCPGAELFIVVNVLGIGTPGVPYPVGKVPTVGLPLLMEFKCFPDDGALGLNAFDISIANNNSSRPNFRIFSSGGAGPNGVIVIKDPDLEDLGTGGFNPTSVPPGQPTAFEDNVFYIGQMDLVTRISRAHTIWFATNSTGSPVFSTPVIEPRDVDQAPGTSLVIAYRGATNVTGNITKDARLLDAYGEPVTGGGAVSFLNGDRTWKSSLSQLQGAKFFQARITFVSNAETGLTPELSALGFAFTQ